LAEFTYLWVDFFLSSEIKGAIDMVKIQGFWNVTSRLLVNCLLGLLVPEKTAPRYFKTSANISQKTWCHTTDHSNLQQYRREHYFRTM
jgi:hypothetical protein